MADVSGVANRSRAREVKLLSPIHASPPCGLAARLLSLRPAFPLRPLALLDLPDPEGAGHHPQPASRAPIWGHAS